jgi:hypothetical protein
VIHQPRRIVRRGFSLSAQEILAMTKTLPPDPEGKNDDRAKWAAAALRQFRHTTGADHEDSLGDLLCDLMHWSDRNNFDFEAALSRAQGHYQAETEGDLLTAAQAALDYLTDHAIDLDGEPEERLAGLRIGLADAIAKAKGGAP